MSLLQIPRVECHDCHLTRQVPVDFAEPRRRYTHAFERYALDLSRHTTIKDVADHLGTGWDTIKDIQRRHLEKHFAKPKLKHLRLLAIDEIAVGKGHRHRTVALDLENNLLFTSLERQRNALSTIPCSSVALILTKWFPISTFDHCMVISVLPTI